MSKILSFIGNALKNEGKRVGRAQIREVLRKVLPKWMQVAPRRPRPRWRRY